MKQNQNPKSPKVSTAYKTSLVLQENLANHFTRYQTKLDSDSGKVIENAKKIASKLWLLKNDEIRAQKYKKKWLKSGQNLETDNQREKPKITN